MLAATLGLTVPLIQRLAVASPSQAPAAAAAQAGASALVDDWNRHDMTRFAQLFAEDADFVNVIGLWWHGRSEIQKQHEALHATRMRQSRLVAMETAVRLLGDDVAVVHVRWRLTGDTGIDGVTLPMRQGVMSLVIVRKGSKWQIESAQNTDSVEQPNVPPQR
jgi:uncharacterized protein (TIGR02246 family)